ncbi:MAG: hypothetical protein E7369_00370 [Clostridiales bacterium]|nr:hypothetical protein [Clostridiales bacterium]
MKRFKKILVNVIAVLVALTACLGLTACEDIKKLEVTVSVYDADETAIVDKTLTVDLYRHLAPTTVDHIINELVNKDYYNNAIFYQDASYTSQIMMGDLVYSDGEIVKNAEAPKVQKAEFTNGGTIGSNLKAKKGSIGLWRTWSAGNGTYKTNADLKTGSGTWFIPESTMTSYDDWFCIFAQIDLENETNSEVFTAISTLFDNTESYENYVVYYTGEYDNLTYHCVSQEDFNEYVDEDDVFVAEDGEYVCYNKRTIRVPFVTVNNAKQLAASIKSVKVK